MRARYVPARAHTLRQPGPHRPLRAQGGRHLSAKRESAETGACTIRVFDKMVYPRKSSSHPLLPRSEPPPLLAPCSSGVIWGGGLVANDPPGPSACRDRERGRCSFLHPAQHQARGSMEWLPRRVQASRLRPRSVQRYSQQQAVRPRRSSCSSQTWLEEEAAEGEENQVVETVEAAAVAEREAAEEVAAEGEEEEEGDEEAR